jgi:hypothetical protein
MLMQLLIAVQELLPMTPALFWQADWALQELSPIVPVLPTQADTALQELAPMLPIRSLGGSQ